MFSCAKRGEYSQPKYCQGGVHLSAAIKKNRDDRPLIETNEFLFYFAFSRIPAGRDCLDHF